MLTRAAARTAAARVAGIAQSLPRGQLTAELLIGRYPVACQPVRVLIIDYLRECQSAVDHATLCGLSRALAGLFWRDLEVRHRGISSLRLDPGVAAAWKRGVTVTAARTTGRAGQVTASVVPRSSGMNTPPCRTAVMA